jgi:hypothetical protein
LLAFPLKNQTQKTIAIGYIPTYGGYQHITHSMHDLLKNVAPSLRQGFSQVAMVDKMESGAGNGAWAAFK